MKRISALLLSVVMFSNVIATDAPAEVETVVEATDNKAFALKVVGGTAAVTALVAATLYTVGKATTVSPALTDIVKNIDTNFLAALAQAQEAANNGCSAVGAGVNSGAEFAQENKAVVIGSVATLAVAGLIAADLARGENSAIRKLAADLQAKLNTVNTEKTEAAAA